MIDNVCFDCARKHLGRANSFIYEWLSDSYPEALWFAIGEISLAEDHLVLSYPEMANKIRQQRLKFMTEDNFYPDLTGLILEISELLKKEEKRLKRKLKRKK